ncbi:hypothetical protein [Mycolicibacterium sp. OfavD-34-C]|uniref:hypothetical protein n=1 Tax=Mycolicibacterium sp. OfavD-34-C TaxID=2917746 RepID=UPI001EF6189C|nr:hypothetical protein [Mycolicibacterium sp. OfavD-34-C]MCG7580086.1 hypothetical protein [Mycolicibacterium sp. OfavD-34-C]
MHRPRSLAHIGGNAKYLLHVRRQAEAICNLANRLGCEFLLSHGPHFPTAAAAARQSKLRFAVMIHSGVAPSWTAKMLRLVQRPDVVFWELPSTRERYMPLFSDVLSTQIPAVLDAQFADSNTCPSARSSSLKRVGLVAAFSPRKRIDKFLALAEHPLTRDIEFHLIGFVAREFADWWENDMATRVSRLRRTGRLKIADGTHGVSAEVGLLDGLIITSDDEGVPNVAMEALAVGARVISLELEGVDILRQQLASQNAELAITIVPRGPDEITKLAECLNQPVLELTREEIAAAARFVTRADYGAQVIAAALRRGMSNA